MAIGKKKVFEHIRGFKEEIKKASVSDPDNFFNWFDESGGDVDSNFLKGQCEFSFYILRPLIKLLKEPENKTALEIGYGGGRLLAAAAPLFREVIGIDIHENSSEVEKELKKRNLDNYKLMQTDGKKIPLEDSSIDLVYSFIVLQHLEKIDILRGYVNETYRVMKKGGFAVLFFGRMYQHSSNTDSKLLYGIDNFFEKIHPKGYQEVFAKVNCTNLKVTRAFIKKMSKRAGFSIKGEGVSRKLPDMTRYGGQHFLVLKK